MTQVVAPGAESARLPAGRRASDLERRARELEPGHPVPFVVEQADVFPVVVDPQPLPTSAQSTRIQGKPRPFRSYRPWPPPPYRAGPLRRATALTRRRADEGCVLKLGQKCGLKACNVLLLVRSALEYPSNAVSEAA